MKKLIPFITEFCVFVLSVAGVVIGLVCGGFFHFSVKPHLVSLAACGIFVVVLGWLFVPQLWRGIGAILDVVFKKYICCTGKVINVLPLEASVFVDQFSEDYTVSRGHRYCYILKINGQKMLSVISNEYFLVEPNFECNFMYGKHSRVLIDLTPKQEPD